MLGRQWRAFIGRSSFVVQPFRASCSRSEDAPKGWTTYEDANLATLQSATVSPQILMRGSIKAKSSNAALIKQEGRQDEKHVRMMILCVAACFGSCLGSAYAFQHFRHFTLRRVASSLQMASTFSRSARMNS